jgi:glycosyltransferase involved in cell wall biosynthesis
MNILQIGTTDKRGGAAAIGLEIKNELEKKDCFFSLFVADKLSKDENVYSIKRNLITRYLSFLLTVEDLYRTDWIMKTKQYIEANIIHCHNLHGRFFNLSTLKKMSLEKPVIWTLHDEWAITSHCVYTYETNLIKNDFYECPSKEMPPRILWNNEKYLKWKKSNILKQSKINIVVPSLWLKKRVENSHLAGQNITLIYNGIDDEIFQPIDKKLARQKLNLPQNKKIILFLADGGSKVPWKGWDYAKRVANDYTTNSEVLFLCVGNEFASDAGKNIYYLPLIKEQKLLAEYYSACDLFLYPSIADNFPLVVLEAMACGLPVVSFDTGGIKEAVIHKENGFIARYKDYGQLLEGVNYIIQLSNDKKNQIAGACRDRVIKNFTSKDMVNNYFNLYKEIVNNYAQ